MEAWQVGEREPLMPEVALPKAHSATKGSAPKSLASEPEQSLESRAVHIIAASHRWLFKFKFIKMYK